MAEFSPITPLQSNSLEDLNRLITQLNESNSRLAVTLATIQGQDGTTPQFSNNVDLGANRLTNVGRGVQNSDVPTIGQLRDFGLFASAGQPHVANTPIIANAGVQVPALPLTQASA